MGKHQALVSALGESQRSLDSARAIVSGLVSMMGGSALISHEILRGVLGSTIRCDSSDAGLLIELGGAEDDRAEGEGAVDDS